MRPYCKQRRLAAVIVEMALVGPVALILLLGIVDIGLAVWNYNNLAEAVREGGRYATIHGAKYATWYAGPPSPPVAGAPAAVGPAANNPDVEQVVRKYAFALDSSKLQVLSNWPNGDNKPNSPVTVDAYYSFSPLITFKLGTLQLHTQTTMRINY